MTLQQDSTYKGKQLAAYARENGWEAKGQPDGERCDVELWRGDERIAVYWINGSLVEAPLYTLAGSTTKLRNVSEIKKQLLKQPDLSRRLRRNRTSKVVEEAPDNIEKLLGMRLLLPPFEDMEDREVLRELYNHSIVWINRLTQMPDEDAIRRGINYNADLYHMSLSSAGRRIVNFMGVFQFRSVALDTLVQVR